MTYSSGPDPSGEGATKRLLFWLRVPYVLDVVLAAVGIGYLVTGDGVGWWVLLFAFLRAVIGTVSLFWIAPRVIARRAAGPSGGTAAASEQEGASEQDGV